MPDIRLQTSGHLTGSMNAAERDACIAVAATIDCDAAADISAAIAADCLRLAWLPNVGSPPGAHDYNTIAIRPGLSPFACAVALLHEWEHVQNTNGGPAHGGTIGDGRTGSECYDCIHAFMNLQSWHELANLICDPPAIATEADCAALRNIGQETSLADDCLIGSCLSGMSIVDPYSGDCPNCPE
ncbi:MAG: hypothetical protein GY725_22225 [bacterium]|nr:hypothetical protein [bacterium]